MAFRSSSLDRLKLTLVLGATALTTLSVSHVAEAAGKKDKEALKLYDKAMDEDYLSVEFDKAEGKLKKAIELCGKDQCSSEVVGKLYVGLATVHGVGQNKLDVAKSDLVSAVKADAGCKLIDGLSTPELEKKLKEAQAEAGGGGGGEGGEGGEGGKGGKGGEGGEAPAPAKVGDFAHTPLAEAPVNTPLPIFAEIPDEIGATKVVVRYKPFGGTKWQTLALAKMEGGFGGEVPCTDVTTTGDFKYYIIATDDQGLSLAGAGSLKDPYKIPIKNKISGDPPSLPGKQPPKACMAAQECPPGLPGCSDSERGDKPAGSMCEETKECMSGLTCQKGSCEVGEEPKAGGKQGKKNLISVSAQFDLAYIGSGDKVCDRTSTANYACFEKSTNAPYYGNPTVVTGSNGISGGLGLAQIRLLAGYDRILPLGFSVGARAGVALLGSPGPDVQNHPPPKGRAAPNSFLPLHLEVRGGWMLAKDGVSKGKIFPHAFIGGGVAQVNAGVPVSVCDPDPNRKETVSCGNAAAGTAGKKVDVTAYQVTGQGFVDFGGGATYMIVDNFGIQAEVKFMVMLPTTGFVVAPVIAPMVAF